MLCCLTQCVDIPIVLCFFPQIAKGTLTSNVPQLMATRRLATDPLPPSLAPAGERAQLESEGVEGNATHV